MYSFGLKIMMRLIQIYLIFVISAGITCAQKNVLFLVADDMRPQLNTYSGANFPSSVSPTMITPHLDLLASTSLLLERAYVQVAMCSPSRSSFLTGRRPDTTHVYDLQTNFRSAGGNFTTIPQYFKENNYTSIGMGKIFHPGVASGNDDDELSWSDDSYFHGIKRHEGSSSSWYAVPSDELVNKPLRDTQIKDKAIETLRDLAPDAITGTKNFFLAVGFHKPHDPFVFPEEFMIDNYPENSINIPDNDYAPVNMPDNAWNSFSTLRSYDDITNLTGATGEINDTLPDDTVKALRRAYYSAVTWVDSLIGEVILELTELNLYNDTIICFIGDHGWQLGEHGEWGKLTNFELSTHAPMMIRIPNVTDSGIRSDQLVEFVDLFPTLVEAAELDAIPVCPEDSSSTEVCSEGMSLIPLITYPSDAIKDASFSQFRQNDATMGYTMRTDQYRYTEWVAFDDAPDYGPNWARLRAAELYNNTADADENYNRADDGDYSSIRSYLSTMLHNGWRAAIVDQDRRREERLLVEIEEQDERILAEIEERLELEELISVLDDLN